MPPTRNSPSATAARTLPIAWCAVGFFYLLQALLWTLFVSWTPIAYVEWLALENPVPLCIWFFLALGVLSSATGCAVAWTFVLLDPTGCGLPRFPTRTAFERHELG